MVKDYLAKGFVIVNQGQLAVVKGYLAVAMNAV